MNLKNRFLYDIWKMGKGFKPFYIDPECILEVANESNILNEMNLKSEFIKSYSEIREFCESCEDLMFINENPENDLIAFLELQSEWNNLDDLDVQNLDYLDPNSRRQVVRKYNNWTSCEILEYKPGFFEVNIKLWDNYLHPSCFNKDEEVFTFYILNPPQCNHEFLLKDLDYESYIDHINSKETEGDFKLVSQ